MTRTVVAALPVAVAGGHYVARLLALARVIGRKPLDDAIASEHASIDGEVPAYHEGPHGSVLLGQGVRFVRNVRLVLPSIDQHEARVPAGVPIALVGRVLPPTTPAQAYRIES